MLTLQLLDVGNATAIQLTKSAFEPDVIDAHVHHWDLRTTPRQPSPLVKLIGWHPRTLRWIARRVFPGDVVQFFGSPDHVLDDYLPRDYAADTDGRVRSYVHVEAGWIARGPFGPVAETAWVEDLAPQGLLAIVGRADLSLGAVVDSVLAAHRQASPRLRGIRHILAHHASPTIMDGCNTPGLSLDPAWREGYARLAHHGLSFEATVYHHQLEEIAALARSFADTSIIVSHAGTPVALGGRFGDEGTTPADRARIRQAWSDGMRRLAERSNVFVKISGLAMPIVGWGYHERAAPTSAEVAEDIAPLLDVLLGSFGSERCMFGSNFPVDKVSMPWTTLHDAVSMSVATRTETERRNLFADTAIRVYGP